eukprot:COSAG01_NODE_1853_length_9060_cov_13.741576_3_plen_183_part_00
MELKTAITVPPPPPPPRNQRHLLRAVPPPPTVRRWGGRHHGDMTRVAAHTRPPWMHPYGAWPMRTGRAAASLPRCPPLCDRNAVSRLHAAAHALAFVSAPKHNKPRQLIISYFCACVRLLPGVPCNWRGHVRAGDGWSRPHHVTRAGSSHGGGLASTLREGAHTCHGRVWAVWSSGQGGTGG